MSAPFERYLDVVERLLREAREANAKSIPAAAAIVADTVARDGIVRAFGTGHSELLARELFDRAGGLVGVDVIVDPTRGRAENVEGYAATLLHDDQLRPPDCLVVASASGRNIAPFELALVARERSVPVVAITSVPFSTSVESRHRSGRRLFEVADVVLDTRVPPGDAAIHLEGVAPEVGPLSTVVGAAILDAVVVEAIGLLVARGVEPPVFASQNIDGVDAWNEALNARYRSRIRALY